MNSFIDIHTHNKISQNRILNLFIQKIDDSISEKTLVSTGIHPWHIEEVNLDSELEKLVRLSKMKKICAVGEIGLDLLTKTSMELQKEVFIRQIEIAEKYRLPVIIHSVKTFNEIIAVKKNRKNPTDWIIHGFNNNLQIARELIKHKCFISFGSALLKNNSNAAEVIKNIPLENLFFETDESEVSIKEVYTKASELLKIELNELNFIVKENFKRCFGKD